jgi:hypothetical protein
VSNEVDISIALQNNTLIIKFFMTTSNRFSGSSARVIVAAALASSSLLALALPSFAHAATYAFVNTAGEVNAVTADSWMAAIANAVNIHVHSGVMLLATQNDNILNTSI